MCELFGCILNNHLIADDHKYLYTWVSTQTNQKAKEKMVIEILKDKQPSKLRKVHEDNYYLLKRKEGIDLDRHEVDADILEKHRAGRKITVTKSKIKSKKIKKEEEDRCISFGGKFCPLIGFIDKHLAHPAKIKQYAPVYLNKETGFHIVCISGHLRGYHPDILGKHIKPYYPDAEKPKQGKAKSIVGQYLERHKTDSDVTLSVNANNPRQRIEHELYLQHQTMEQFLLAEKYGWKIAKMLTAPQENFHLED